MSNLFTTADPVQASYARIYDALTELRESFHRSGRLDDSNAKLDEVTKILATYLAYRTKEIPSFPSEETADLIAELQDAFARTARLPRYQSKAGLSVFGTHPTLVLRKGDETLARELVQLVRDCVDLALVLRAQDRPFDILNEAFGHFVRDNFRGNVEDAQYMTPPEVVSFMVDLALDDMRIEEPGAGDPDWHLTVLDPTCGVGSFLGAVYHQARQSDWLATSRLRLFGQDKVERMVRLSTINLGLFETEKAQITIGNSLETGSQLDDLNGSVDLILTNPPFGARFDHSYVASECADNTPFFASLQKTASTVSSELLFVDRNLKLLREGGRLLIVVPDGVVSSRGTAAMLRHHLSGVATLRAVIELPATTFAQAGTRTKTSVLYLQKGRSATPPPTFMAICGDLGFQVSSRKGVQVKVSEGANDLPVILEAYRSSRHHDALDAPHIESEVPSCVRIPEAVALSGSWTPSHYSAARYASVASMSRNAEVDLVPLRDLVEFCGDRRRASKWTKGDAFISVLHILGEGFVDAAAALSYSPKTPGIPVEPGEILMSKINPRIPRVCVAPDFRRTALCSSEFEVMRPSNGLSAYALAYLLQTSAVQDQVKSLTSGTSASHNRIRTSELAEVMVPVPRKGTSAAESLKHVTAQYEDALRALADNAILLAGLRARDMELLSS